MVYWLAWTLHPPLTTAYTFPPLELDYDIISPRRVVRLQIVKAAHDTRGVDAAEILEIG